jgi:glutaredoxin-like YruB-family protein
MEFNEAKELKNVIKGCQSPDFYKNLIEESLFRAEMKAEGKPQKRVTVYSTPTCSWCNTLKTHLRKHRIMYTDIDVSQNQEAAKAMVAKSGQQGVPQTDINGEMIIGFDKKRINELLEIK